MSATLAGWWDGLWNAAQSMSVLNTDDFDVPFCRAPVRMVSSFSNRSFVLTRKVSLM